MKLVLLGLGCFLVPVISILFVFLKKDNGLGK